MSEKYEPKKGDRVRVVIEGTVGANAGGWIDVGDSCVRTAAKCVVSVERLADPLPTTPGSVIRHRVTGFTYTVTPGGGIFSHSLERIIRHASVFEEVAEHYHVLHDAGAAK